MKAALLVICILVTGIANAQKNTKWTSLFDGKSFNGWKQLTGTAHYEIVNGEIIGTATVGKVNSFLVTEKTYKDFILELEVRIQDSTINSGVQFRSALDEQKGVVYGYQFEVDGSSRRWSGGIYDESRRQWLYTGALNPKSQDAFRLADYNKVRIECKGGVVCTWLNGKPVSYLVDTATTPGFIALQVHNTNNPDHAGKKIYWKNIRIKTGDFAMTPFPKNIFVVNTQHNALSPQEKSGGWKLLFDGKSNNGWKGAYQSTFPPKGWSVANGELKVLPSDGGESTNGGDIVTTKQFAAFDLSFDFKLTPGANSGVKYFVTLSENNKGSAIGLEYQLLDDTLHPDAKMGVNGNRTLASLYDLITASKQSRFINQPGKWNSGRIVVHPDNHVEHYLNGVKVLEYDRGSADFRQRVATSKYKVWSNFGEASKGYILLQDHGNEVSFRSIKIKEL